MSEGELHELLKKWISEFVPNITAKEMEQELLKIAEEMKADFYLAVKHLKHLKIESPYLESIIEKWLGEKEESK